MKYIKYIKYIQYVFCIITFVCIHGMTMTIYYSGYCGSRVQVSAPFCFIFIFICQCREFDWSGLVQDADVANLIGQGWRRTPMQDHIDPTTLVEFDELLSVVMWLGKTLIGIFVINTLTMLTIAHADRGKPTLNDDERPFRYGLFRE